MGRSPHQEASSAVGKACASISPRKIAPMQRSGVDNVARPGLTVWGLLELREAVHDRWWRAEPFRQNRCLNSEESRSEVCGHSEVRPWTQHQHWEFRRKR